MDSAMLLTPTSTIQQLLKHRTPGKAAVKLPNAAFHAAGDMLERMALLTTFCDLSIGMGEVGKCPSHGLYTSPVQGHMETLKQPRRSAR